MLLINLSFHHLVVVDLLDFYPCLYHLSFLVSLIMLFLMYILRILDLLLLYFVIKQCLLLLRRFQRVEFDCDRG